MTIPSWVKRNMKNYGNCSLPRKLIKDIGISDLEQKLDCHIREVTTEFSDGVGRHRSETFYIAERGKK